MQVEERKQRIPEINKMKKEYAKTGLANQNLSSLKIM